MHRREGDWVSNLVPFTNWLRSFCGGPIKGRFKVQGVSWKDSGGAGPRR